MIILEIIDNEHNLAQNNCPTESIYRCTEVYPYNQRCVVCIYIINSLQVYVYSKNIINNYHIILNII